MPSQGRAEARALVGLFDSFRLVCLLPDRLLVQGSSPIMVSPPYRTLKTPGSMRHRHYYGPAAGLSRTWCFFCNLLGIGD